ncbi:MAG: transporter substrate-binding domain-containing protein [Lachnospiraceae bacterium]|nr:transporter substrate-binding domain-containing protein [Lachnospiraceae bacterium]
MRKIRIFAGTILTAAMALSLTACGSKAAAAGADKASTTASTSQSEETSEGGVKIVEVAHTNYYKPYDFETEDGQSDGYEVAVLKAVDELLEDYEFHYTPTTDDDLLIGVESGKYDLGTKGVWWTEARSKTYVFPENYIGASVIGITYRAEDADKYTDLEAFAKSGGKLVPIAPQNAQYNIVENFNNNHPDSQIKLESSDQFEISDAYQWILEGRYDAYFNIKTSFESNVVAEDGEYHDLADKLGYTAYEGIPTWPLFNRDNQELADKYDEAIEKLKADGTLEKLSQQYFGEDILKYVPEGYKKGDVL